MGKLSFWEDAEDLSRCVATKSAPPQFPPYTLHIL